MNNTVAFPAWFKDANFPFEDWQYEVDNGSTNANYLAWVLSQYESNEWDVPSEVLAMQSSPQDDGLDEQGYAQVPPHEAERFNRADWQEEVTAGDTRLGYQAWLQHQVEAAQNEER